MLPESRAVSSQNVLVYVESGLYTITFFDAPVLEDAQLAVATMNDVLERGVRAAAVLDLRQLREISPATFSHVAEPIIRNRAGLSKVTRSFAVLHEGGMAAAAVAGGVAMYLGDVCPINIFTHVDAAFHWSGFSQVQAREYRERVEDFRATPTLTRQCRAYIESRVVEASLAGCAKHLDLSEDTLQRELTRAGTSFRTELRSVRISAAQGLLSDTDDTVANVGERVGYKKSQNFTDAFRKATGMTPAAWRKLQR